MPPTTLNDATPGVVARISSARLATSLVRSSEAAFGNWTLASSTPWSSMGTKPVGTMAASRPPSRATPAIATRLNPARRASDVASRM